jgi:NitT/TauT family transport system substrate-binding protein
MAQTEMDGYGRILFMTKDVWPEFISCVLAVNENIIRSHRPDVQHLVDGIASSGCHSPASIFCRRILTNW